MGLARWQPQAVWHVLFFSTGLRYPGAEGSPEREIDLGGADKGSRSCVMLLELGRGLGVGGRGGCWPLAQRRWFLSGFPFDLGMKPHNRKFPSVYLCGKGDPQSLYLTLAYAKMQRAELFSLSPLSFLLRQKL